MGRLAERYRDVIEFVYPAEDPLLQFKNERGFLAWLRSLSEEEVVEFAKQFVVWRDNVLGRCPVLRLEEEGDGEKRVEYRVFVPKVRYLNRRYYAFLKDLELYEGRYRLITLTLYRNISIVEAWKNINKWVSRCLHRIRNRLRRQYKVDLYYVWVIETHRDGYPHVHILICLSRFVAGLTFEVFLKMLQECWVDDNGNRLCSETGIDHKYIFLDVDRVKEYVLKYLVKDHSNVWTVEQENCLVRVRLCALLIWVFRVRLFGVSQKVKRIKKSKRYVVTYLGRTSAYRLYRLSYVLYKNCEVSFAEFLGDFLKAGRSWALDEERVLWLIGGGLRAGPLIN